MAMPVTPKRAYAGHAVAAKRNKRNIEAEKLAYLAIFIFAAFFVILGLLTSRIPSTIASGNASSARLLKSRNGGSDGSDGGASPDVDLEERMKLKEERYQSLYRVKFDESTLGYDIYNCPSTPPQDYPMAWPITEVLTNWNPNDVTTVSPNYRSVYQGLCVFDYETQYETALAYRNAEKPFIIRNDPKVTSVSQKWDDDPEYLHQALGDMEEFRTERSPDNHFMWFRLGGKKDEPKGYRKPLNDEIEMTFGEWLEHAIRKDGKALGNEELLQKARAMGERRMSLVGSGASGELPEEDDVESDGSINTDSEEEKQKKWYYFRLNANLKHTKKGTPDRFIYDELSFFDPRRRKDSEFYIVDSKEERGINCRFGMRGVIAASHFDLSRNMIAILGGERRYILGHPSQCTNMALYNSSHPSRRHSSIDWSNPNEWDHHPDFKHSMVNEVVMHAGDVLYLPTSWFHYIVNLGLNYQCNARSGITYENAHYIEDCGFDTD